MEQSKMDPKKTVVKIKMKMKACPTCGHDMMDMPHEEEADGTEFVAALQKFLRATLDSKHEM